MAFQWKKAALILAVSLAVITAGCGLAGRPTAARTATPAQTSPALASSLPPPSPSAAAEPTDAQILAAFEEIAFSSEYGNLTREIRKWTGKMRVSVQGEPTGDDRAALRRAMDGLNAVAGFPGAELSDQDVNVTVWYVPSAKMPEVVEGYQPGNWGYFTISSDRGAITRATVAVATDVTDQQARNHLIFEELLQSAGLMQDLYDYHDSIFFGGWTTVQQPLNMDWKMLGMLYLPGLKPGMGESDAMNLLKDKYGVKQ